MLADDLGSAPRRGPQWTCERSEADAAPSSGPEQAARSHGPGQMASFGPTANPNRPLIPSLQVSIRSRRAGPAECRRSRRAGFWGFAIGIERGRLKRALRKVAGHRNRSSGARVMPRRLHHSTRNAELAGTVVGDDFCQSELFETVIERGASSLCGVGLGPNRPRANRPSDLDPAGVKWAS